MGHKCEPSLERLLVIKAELEAEKPADMDKKLVAINSQIKRKAKEAKAKKVEAEKAEKVVEVEAE